MTYKEKQKIFEYLLEFVTENKKTKLKEISSNRTNHLTLVLEDISENKDTSATIRTCECFGLNSVNVIESNKKYKINHDVSMGSFKWLTINRFDDKKDCIETLKNQNYRIVSTSPSNKYKPIEELDLSKKTALFFGSEENGLSEYILENSDEIINIPMTTYVESFNLSASAAIILYTLVNKMRKDNVAWQLSDEECLDLKLSWIRQILKSHELLEKILHQKECFEAEKANRLKQFEYESLKPVSKRFL